MSAKRLELGKIVVHDTAAGALQRAHQRVEELLEEFASGNFGDVDAEDYERNRQALKNGGELLAIFQLCTKVVIWIVSDGKTTEVFVP